MGDGFIEDCLAYIMGSASKPRRSELDLALAELARLRAAEAELKAIRDYMESFHEVETIEEPVSVLASVHERITKVVGSSNDAK